MLLPRLLGKCILFSLLSLHTELYFYSKENIKIIVFFSTAIAFLLQTPLLKGRQGYDFLQEMRWAISLKW